MYNKFTKILLMVQWPYAFYNSNMGYVLFYSRIFEKKKNKYTKPTLYAIYARCIRSVQHITDNAHRRRSFGNADPSYIRQHICTSLAMVTVGLKVFIFSPLDGSLKSFDFIFFLLMAGFLQARSNASIHGAAVFFLRWF